MSKLPSEIIDKKASDKELFHTLTEELRAKGLLEKTPVRGALELLIEIAGYILLFTFLPSLHPFVAGLLFVLLMLRSTFIAHDLLHKQYFSRKVGFALALIFGNLLLGLSGRWWDKEHNVSHHTYTNAADKDSDLQSFGGALKGRHDSIKFIHRYQHIFFFLLLPLIYASFAIQSYQFALKYKNRSELIFMLLHLLIPASILYILGVNDGLITVATMYIGYGLALALVTITNHLGLPLHYGDEYKRYSWIDLQTRGSRNIKGGRIIHYFFGGLNTQIEHHLFPHASRFKLLEIAKYTQQFCQEHNFHYYKTTPMQAYKEIYFYLKALRYKG